MPKQPDPGRSPAKHDPTPEERDERLKLDLDPEEALRVLLRTPPVRRRPAERP